MTKIKEAASQSCCLELYPDCGKKDVCLCPQARARLIKDLPLGVFAGEKLQPKVTLAIIVPKSIGEE